MLKESLTSEGEKAPDGNGNNLPNKNTSAKDILLSLNNDIADVRDKKDILNLIHPKLKLLFNIEDIFICFFDEKNETLDPVLRIGNTKRTAHPDYDRIINSSFPIHDGFIDEILRSKEPRVVDIIKFQNPPDYMRLSTMTGLAETLSVPLYNAGKIVGVLTLWSEIGNFFTAYHRNLITEIANYISIVVVNISANESIRKKDKQNEILLSISNELARIQGKQDMLHIIQHTIKRYVSFDDSLILRFSKMTKTCSPYIYQVENGQPESSGSEKQMNVAYLLHDDNHTDHQIPVVEKITSSRFSEDQELPFIRRAGIVEFVKIKLIEHNELIGFFILLSKRENSFKTDDLELLQRISYHISIATANIIAREEIENREDEKTILLGLSNEIASIRDRKNLFTVVNTRLKSLFSIKYFGIALINTNQQTYSSFILDLEEQINQLPGYRKLIADKHYVTDHVFSSMMNSETPIMFDVNRLAAKKDVPAIVHFWKNAKLRRVLGMALRVGGKNIGCVFLHLFPEETIRIKDTLLKGVCAQLSMKVANILAYEDIAKREEEKTILLSLSHEIASLKNRDDLFLVVNNRIKEIFSISQFGITKIDEDQQTHSVFMIDLGQSNQNSFSEAANSKFKITDQAFHSVMAAEEPIILDIKQLMKTSDNSAHAELWQYPYFLCLALRVGGRDIGCIFLNIESDTSNSLKNNLLAGVCAQLAVAVSNILANEKVLHQLTEINNYKQQLEEEKTYLKEEIETSQNHSEIIGDSPGIKKVFQMVKQVAYSDSTVLLLGETGTGKELIARAIHNASPRKNKLMVKVNCAALPPSLIESELFGHERGSFTGAFERRIGKFELADKGTLFLDEIGELSLDLQAKLLRVLQEKEIERIGGKNIIKTDARIIAATNRDLVKLMEEGKFRTDLFYRLNIFPITLPPLRNRPEDIAKLASFFAGRYAKKAGKKITTITNKALQELLEYEWPGNIRELEHLMERSVLLATGETIKEIHLPSRRKSLNNGNGDQEALVIKTIDENEKEYILKILKHTNGRVGGIGGAADLLDIPPSTLNSKMKRLGIRKEHFG